MRELRFQIGYGDGLHERANLELQEYTAPDRSDWLDHVGANFQNKFADIYNNLIEKENYYLQSISDALEKAKNIEIPEIRNY